MPRKEHQRQGGRRGQRLRVVVLAAMLAVVSTVLVAGSASADGWPHDNYSSSNSDSHHHK
jgi:hypothetical protein